MITCNFPNKITTDNKMSTKTPMYMCEMRSAFRKPAWRWYEATREADSRRKPTGEYWIDAARNFIVARRQSHGRGKKRSVPDPAIAEAERIYGTPDDRRAELEALLLTSMPLESIAQRLGFELATVDAYANLFFHVRDRLKAVDWMMNQVIGRYPESHFAAEQERLWKYFAYAGGVLILDSVIAVTLGRPLPPHVLPDGATEEYEKRLRFRVNLHIALLSTTSLSVTASLAEIYREFLAATGGCPEEIRSLEIQQQILEVAAGKKPSARRTGDGSLGPECKALESEPAPLRLASPSKPEPRGDEVTASQLVEALVAADSSYPRHCG